MNFEQKMIIVDSYISAVVRTTELEKALDKVLSILSKANDGSFVEVITTDIETIAHAFLTTEEFDWLLWWVYDADLGRRDMEFSVDGVEYKVSDLHRSEFFEIVFS